MDFLELNYNFAISRRKVDRVGLAFLNSKRNECLADDQINRSDSSDKLLDEEFKVDINYLKSLDPKEWKDHDHYAIFGLGKLRFDATDDDIRRAYRRMVLKHHPDKRKAKGEDVNTDDDYFTCITKAYEILGTPKTRRAYDSVDPEFDDSFPTQSDIENRFYESFNKYFNLNARWSEKKNIPSFGDENAKRADVEEFYRFWYDFKSWREFSYLDEEDKEKGQDRDERRWIEKENKVARIKRKKEEMMRIRALVDLAYNNDKRIQKFKNEEKEKKMAAKRAKMDAAQAQKAEAERAARETQLAKERADKAEQKRIEQIRIEKEQLKKALKKERKSLRDKAKECKYFASNDKDSLKNMEGVEKICETFNTAELQELNKQMEKANGGGTRDAFFAALKKAEKKIEAELDEINQTHKKPTKSTPPSSSDVKEVKKSDMWTNENVQLLIKAVNLFPAGTIQRWDVIATFVNQHSGSGGNVTARDVLNKAKALQNSDFSKSSLKTQANDSAFESFEKSKKDVQTCMDITVNNINNTAEKIVNNSVGKNGTNCTNSNAKTTTTKTSSAAATATTNNHIETSNGPLQKDDSKENCDNTTSAAATTTTTPTPNTKPTPAPQPNTKQSAASNKVWTKEEQALLEQAIKTYPITTADRWDRIAECIPNRTKKDCLRRVKELVELVNSKKEAQQSVK